MNPHALRTHLRRTRAGPSSPSCRQGPGPPRTAAPRTYCGGRLLDTQARTGRGDLEMSEIGFLKVPEHSTEAQEIFDEDMDELGFVMNVSKLWAYQPATLTGLFDLLQGTTLTHRFTLRQRGILIAACASTLGDAYCSLGWGSKLDCRWGA